MGDMEEINFRCFELNGRETEEELIAMGAYTAEQCKEMRARCKEWFDKVGAIEQDDGTYLIETEKSLMVYAWYSTKWPNSIMSKKAIAKLSVNMKDPFPKL